MFINYFKILFINNIMHYLMLISDKPDMVFRAELAMRSIQSFSPKETFFSIIVNGEELKPLTSFPLTPYIINNKYITNNAEVFYCPYHWSIPAPSRWFIKPKTEQCVFIDVDIIACRDLSPLYEFDANTIHGVTAIKQILTTAEWQSIGLNQDELKYYFNFGMIIVPSKYLSQIGKEMMANVPMIMTLFPQHQYFAGQIALAYTLKNLNIKKSSLPSIFNWYDLKKMDNINEVIFLHYMENQNEVINYKKATNPQVKNPILDFIAEKTRSIMPIYKTYI